jgi:quercetin dioxygenase-like cupin family protein
MVLTAAVPAICQDLVTVASQAAKVEYEDARVRVVRLKIAPHEALPMHDRPARVVIALTANDVRITAADGSMRTVQVPAGNIAWSGPGKRSVTNLDTPLENVVVEMKELPHPPPNPGGRVGQPPSKDDPRALVAPYHRWLFENQYVRVYDVHIPPGGMTEFHRHAYDTVIVQVSGGLTAAQVQGGEWGKPETAAQGTVEFTADSRKTRIHRVRNEGKTEFHVVLVQLLQ